MNNLDKFYPFYFLSISLGVKEKFSFWMEESGGYAAIKHSQNVIYNVSHYGNKFVLPFLIAVVIVLKPNNE